MEQIKQWPEQRQDKAKTSLQTNRLYNTQITIETMEIQKTLQDKF